MTSSTRLHRRLTVRFIEFGVKADPDEITKKAGFSIRDIRLEYYEVYRHTAESKQIGHKAVLPMITPGRVLREAIQKEGR